MLKDEHEIMSGWKNTREPVVSIICTAYNHESYIKESIEGFLSQETNFSFEIIIHDDASTDNTAKIIREYEKKYPNIIKPIYQRENQYSKGVRISLSLCKNICKGKYVAFCEGDDYWTDSKKLQKQYDALSENPQCKICCCLVLCCDEKGNKLDFTIPKSSLYFSNKTGIISCDEVASLLLKQHIYPFQTSSYFIERSVLLKEDKDLNHLLRDEGTLRRCILEGDFYYIGQPMSMRRFGSKNSWSMTYRKGGKNSVLKILKEQFYMDLYFDNYSVGKYREYIITNLFDDYYKALYISNATATKLKNECISVYGEEQYLLYYENYKKKLSKSKRIKVFMIEKVPVFAILMYNIKRAIVNVVYSIPGLYEKYLTIKNKQ